MKYLLLFLTITANAALTEPDVSQLTTNRNLVFNSGFENGLAGWYVSGGATQAVNSTAKGTGSLGLDWDSNSSAQSVLSKAVTIPNGYQGKNGLISCNIKTVSGTATHTLSAWDGTNKYSTVTINNSTTSFIQTLTNFIFPSSGTIAIRLDSVASNEPEIYIDDCRIALADNIGTVAQAILVDAVTVTGCAANWTTTSTTLASMGAQTGCTYTSSKGVATAPATNIPAFKFASLPAGDYKIEYEGNVGTSVGSLGAFFQFTDGTNTARELSTFYGGTQPNQGAGISQSISYSSPQSNVTLELKAKVDSGGGAYVIGTTAKQGVFKLWYFPSSSQQAVASAQADFGWTSYPMTIGATTTPPTKGTIVVDSAMYRRIGDTMEINYTYGQSASGSAGSGSYLFPLPSGYTIDTTKLTVSTNGSGAPANIVGSAYAGNTTANGTNFMVPSWAVAYNTTNIEIIAGSGGSLGQVNPVSSANFATSGAAYYSFSIRVPIVGWTTSNRAPTLIGSVTSNSTGAERIERFQVNTTCTSTPCTIATQSGAAVSSISRTTTGTYVVNFTNAFSAAPSCVCNSGDNAMLASSYNESTTTCGIYTSNTGGTLTDWHFKCTCMGSR